MKYLLCLFAAVTLSLLLHANCALSATERILLDVDFEGKTPGQPIATGGAAVGEPVDVSSYVVAIVRDAPMPTRCLEITDNDDFAAGSVRFEFLNNEEITSGVLRITADLWFLGAEYFHVYLREQGFATQSFLSTTWGADLRITANDGNGPLGQIGNYDVGRVFPIEFVYDMGAATYDVILDGVTVVNDEPHGVVGAGIGSVLFGTNNDPDLQGTLYVDNVRATVQEPEAALEITVPPTGLNPALRPPIATYEWRTVPGSADPAEVRWIMLSTVPFNTGGDHWQNTLDYIRNNPNAPEWFPWQPYNPPSSGTSWTTPPMEYGQYVFAIHGRDALGVAGQDFTLDRNARRILVANIVTGPLLTVTGDYIDDIMRTTTTGPPVLIGLDSGTPVNFCFTADASAYSGIVLGYRYGWDVVDPENDGDWEIGWTPFVSTGACSPVGTFGSGTHAFSVEVIDNNGGKSRATIQIEYLLPSVAVDPDTLVFTHSTLVQNLDISSPTLNPYSWTASDDQPWIALSATAGSGDATITVTVDAALAPPPPQEGTITVFSSNGANAAVPVLFRQATNFGGYVGLYADPQGTDCNLFDDVPGLTLLSINVVHTYTGGATASSFSAPMPPCMTGATWVGDATIFPVTAGNSQGGVSISYGACLTAPIHVLTVQYIVSGTSEPCCEYWVGPHPYAASGTLEVVDCASELTTGFGARSIINPAATCPCATVSVHESTWGYIKSLYR